jgi:cysteinyl-tRNA synthetase
VVKATFLVQRTPKGNKLTGTFTILIDRIIGMISLFSLAGIAGLPDAGENSSVISDRDRKKIVSLRQRFESAMDNDFNTAQALGLLFDAVKGLNKVTRLVQAAPSADDVKLIRQGGAELRELAGLLGLLQQDPEQYVLQKKEQLIDSIPLSLEEIDSLIAKRNTARDDKDWATSDEVRDELLSHGIELHDGPDGTTWNVKL